MTPPPDEALHSPQDSETDTPVAAPTRSRKSPLDAVSRLPYRRSNASLSHIFASTTSLPTGLSAVESGPVTPITGPVNGSVFSPGAATPVRSPSPSQNGKLGTGQTDARDLILRAFSPHVSVLASQDTEELVRHKGIHGGLLELLRPYGERVQGKVTVRDSSGVSRSWEDFGVHFMGVKDGLENPRAAPRHSTDSASSQKRHSDRASMLEYKPARFRSGGDVPQVEELVERHLTFAEEQSGPLEADYINRFETHPHDPQATSPFYMLYLRRLLSGLPLTPSETFSHPVATVIAISSRCQNPIEELRNLFASSNGGEYRLPMWVHNEFLRYYVLVHDEDYDDITKSMNLFEQMKRHFGLHCHLLRLRSTQCVESDDGAVKLPHCEWTAAAEELAEIVRRETAEEDEDPTPCIYETDATAVRSFVREMVTQSVVPSMERASATWNEQVASRRRGLSGRFMSLSKRFTTFGGRNSSGPATLGGGGSNYDSLQGFYRPDAPEAVMRKLADYAMMIRDYKLAQSTYEILCQDYKSDKAWRYYAGANEMAAASALLGISGLSVKVRVEAVDQYLETAYFSYLTRVGSAYNALRCLILGIELLKVRGGGALDDAARWSMRLLDDKMIGPTGHALLMERISVFFHERKGLPAGAGGLGERKRKAAFWAMLATDAWLRLDKLGQAEKCLQTATQLYSLNNDEVCFDGMSAFLSSLQRAVRATRNGRGHIDEEDLLNPLDDSSLAEPLQEPQIHPRSPVMGHRKSLSSAVAPVATAGAGLQLQTQFDDPLGAVPSAYEQNGFEVTPLSPRPSGEIGGVQGLSPVVERRERRDDGFE